MDLTDDASEPGTAVPGTNVAFLFEEYLRRIGKRAADMAKQH